MQYIITLLQYISDFFTFTPDPTVIVHQAIGPLVIPLATMAISAASSGYGMIKQGQANNKAQQALDEQNKRYGELSNWYEGESSKSFMDTSVAKSTLSKIDKQYKDSVGTSNSNAARGGATVEAKVANKAALNEKYNDVLNNMVGYGTQYKTNLKREYGNSLQQLAQGQNMGNFANSQGWANIAANAGEAFANTAGSTDWESLGK